MLKKYFYIILFFFSLIVNFAFSDEKIFISVTVDKEIITNIDIKKEGEYLKILNPNLSNLKESDIKEIAKKSLINEIIKKNEIDKYLVKQEDEALDERLLKNLYTNNLSKSEFENLLLQKKNYSLKEIKVKLKNEILWNDLIYFKFKDQVKVDKKKLERKINNISLKTQKEYSLSEIIFEKKTEQNLIELTKKIKTSITEIGFNNSANIYSISETSKFGGKIGWVKEASLSNVINNELKGKKKNDITNVIQIGNNYLILMINDVKDSKMVIDKDKELERLIEFEKNRQINQFSKIFLIRPR